VASALLVVDVQQLLIDRLPPARAEEYLGTLSGVIDRARRAGVPVVYIRHGDEELVPGTRAWGITATIAPAPGEPVVDKRFRDAFRETDLAEVLARSGVDHVIVTGIQTEYCVDATLREAERRGYRVTLVADGTATFDVDGATEAQIRAQVHRVAQGRIAEIVPSADLFASQA
jgi:nicotinamidase-related amidase